MRSLLRCGWCSLVFPEDRSSGRWMVTRHEQRAATVDQHGLRSGQSQGRGTPDPTLNSSDDVKPPRTARGGHASAQTGIERSARPRPVPSVRAPRHRSSSAVKRLGRGSFRASWHAAGRERAQGRGVFRPVSIWAQKKAGNRCAPGPQMGRSSCGDTFDKPNNSHGDRPIGPIRSELGSCLWPVKQYGP